MIQYSVKWWALISAVSDYWLLKKNRSMELSSHYVNKLKRVNQPADIFLLVTRGQEVPVCS